jgi:virginiamycin B lyase
MPKRTFFALVAAGFLCAVPIAGRQAPTGRGGRGGGFDQVTLPDGGGKELVQTACSECHGLGQVANSGGYDHQGWQLTVERMVTDGAKVPPNQVSLVVDYLTKAFPEQPKPRAVLIPGSATVNIKEWEVPTKGSRPHDPLATPDGMIWYTGMYANVIGRLDPKTGQIKEFHLNTAKSGPHGLTADRAGNIWFTANSKGYVGKLDPKGGEIVEYQMPDPGARDPHTPIFDQKGNLWFTLQNSNMIGRLDPQSGAITLVTSPTPRSNPYGMVVNSKGVPFLVEFGSNKVASLDPVTMAIREYPLPNPDSRPRRIAITSDDVIWYSDYSRGYLGRLDPVSGKVTEWPSPGGPKSQPYGITTLHDVIWYSESAVKPNTLVRFDPRTEKFQTWAIPSGGGVVRNMMTTRDGNLVMAESGVNKVALVEMK